MPTERKPPTVTPVRKRYRLADLLAALDSGQKQTEADWGRLVGNETW